MRGGEGGEGGREVGDIDWLGKRIGVKTHNCQKKEKQRQQKKKEKDKKKTEIRNKEE